MVDLLVEEINMAGFGGVSCIVDSATGPRTAQQLENLSAMATRCGVAFCTAQRHRRRKARTARLGGSGAGRRGPRKRTPGVRGAAPSD